MQQISPHWAKGPSSAGIHSHLCTLLRLPSGPITRSPSRWAQEQRPRKSGRSTSGVAGCGCLFLGWSVRQPGQWLQRKKKSDRTKNRQQLVPQTGTGRLPDRPRPTIGLMDFHGEEGLHASGQIDELDRPPRNRHECPIRSVVDKDRPRLRGKGCGGGILLQLLRAKTTSTPAAHKPIAPAPQPASNLLRPRRRRRSRRFRQESTLLGPARRLGPECVLESSRERRSPSPCLILHQGEDEFSQGVFG